jgi:hypothetical protein
MVTSSQEKRPMHKALGTAGLFLITGKGKNLHEGTRSMFMHDLFMLDEAASRNLSMKPIREKDDYEKELAKIMLDVQGFYLMAARAVVSSISIAWDVLPSQARQNLPNRGFNKFYGHVSTSHKRFPRKLYGQLGRELDWLKLHVIDKRDNVIQHWAVNPQKRFMPNLTLYPDVNVVSYVSQEKKYPQNVAHRINKLFDDRTKHELALRSDISEVVERQAVMELWYCDLIDERQDELDQIIDHSIQIVLPVTKNMVDRLSMFFVQLLEFLTKY